jgi:type VI protein secretion system component VasF
MNSNDPLDAAWLALRRDAARRLSPAFAGGVIREARRWRALRTQCLVAVATGVLLFGGIGLGQSIHLSQERAKNAQLWLQYQSTRSALLGTL